MAASRTRSSFFDRFAERSAQVGSGAVFFTACVLLVVVWAPSYFIFGDLAPDAPTPKARVHVVWSTAALAGSDMSV